MRTESQGHLVNTVAIIFGVLTIIVMVLRLYARIFVVKALGPDDSKSYPEQINFAKLTSVRSLDGVRCGTIRFLLATPLPANILLRSCRGPSL